MAQFVLVLVLFYVHGSCVTDPCLTFRHDTFHCIDPTAAGEAGDQKGCVLGANGGGLRMRKLKEGPAINKAHSSTWGMGGEVLVLWLSPTMCIPETHTHKRTLSCISATHHSPHKAFDKL